MWSLKFTVLNKDSVYTLLTAKHKVVDYLYPVDNYRKKGKVFILGVHVLEGEDAAKKAFIRDLRKNRKVIEIEEDGDHIVTLIAEEEEFYTTLFAAELYHTAPVMIKNGYETWDISSFSRAKLENVIHEIEKWKKKFPEFNFHRLSKAKLSEIYFPKITPKIPERQKKAFTLALQKGYYTWPRKVDLGDLAKEMKVSISTLQEHLRKAEAKLLPFFAK